MENILRMMADMNSMSPDGDKLGLLITDALAQTDDELSIDDLDLLYAARTAEADRSDPEKHR